MAVQGGTTDDGEVILPQPLTSDDARIAQYFYVYAIILANIDRCAEALPITQQLTVAVPNDADAAYNVDFIQELCRQSLLEIPPAGQATPTP